MPKTRERFIAQRNAALKPALKEKSRQAFRSFAVRIAIKSSNSGFIHYKMKKPLIIYIVRYAREKFNLLTI
jgi:hypothetical protein